MKNNKRFTPNIPKLNRVFTPSERILHLLFDDIKKYEPLSKKEQDDLVVKYRDGDQKALNKLILHNTRWVVTAAKRFMNERVSLNDLISEGILGLVEGINHYDITKEVKLYTYCSFWIRKRLIDCLTSSTIVRAPQNRSYTRHRVEKISDMIYTQKGEEPTEEEVYSHLRYGHTGRAVADGMRELDKKVHLHSEVNDEVDPCDDAGHKNFFWEDCESILDNEIEFFVIRNSFGFNCEPRDLKDIAERLKMKLDDVEAIYKRALIKLKREFNADL